MQIDADPEKSSAFISVYLRPALSNISLITTISAGISVKISVICGYFSLWIRLTHIR